MDSFYPLRAPTHHSFIFNSRFLYELKHKEMNLKACVKYSIFDFVSFLSKSLFLFNKKHGLFDFKTSLFKIKIIKIKIKEKPPTLLLPNL